MNPRRSGLLLALVGLSLSLSACTAWQPPPIQRVGTDSLARGGTYTVRKGDNIYTIAQKHNVRVHELVSINAMTRPHIIKEGQRLIVPAKDGGVFYAAPEPSPAPLDYIDKGYMGPSGTSGLAGTEAVTAAPLEPLVITGTSPASTLSSPAPAFSSAPETVTAMAYTPPNESSAESYSAPLDLSPPLSAQPLSALPAPLGTDQSMDTSPDGVPVFGWPIRGTIISTYGPKGHGRDNDGINIGAPRGAPVKAAAGGVVVYAGQGMKGFGNLVLIKHTGGWVTAYAHMDRLTVTKDAAVAKGDMIGTVGSTGGVSSPQLHFEARRDGVPVDPELVIKG